MQIKVLIDPKKRDVFEGYIREAGESIQDVTVKHRDSLDTYDLIDIALRFGDPSYALLFFGYALGKGTRFYVDHRGIHLEIRKLEDLKKMWAVWRGGKLPRKPAAAKKRKRNVPPKSRKPKK